MADKQTLQPLELQKSVDMSAVQADVVPWDAQDFVLKNNGICREHGVTNLGNQIGLDSDFEETFYCANGSKVQLKRDTINKCFHVFSDGFEVGIVPEWGVKARQLIPSNCQDVQITITGTLLLLFYAPGIATIQELDIATNEILNSRSFTTPSTITNVGFVRYKQPTYANVQSIYGFYASDGFVSGTVYIIKDDGSTVISYNNVGSTANLPSFDCYYEHGWILQENNWDDTRAGSLFVIKTTGVSTAISTNTIALIADYNQATGNVVYHCFLDAYLSGSTLIYGFTITPPAVDGGAFTYVTLSNVGFNNIVSAKSRQIYTYGGAFLALDSYNNCYFNFDSEKIWATTYNVGPPDIYGDLWTLASDVFFKIHTISGAGAYLSISFDPDGIGSLITEVGEINPYYCPHILKIDSNNYYVSYQRGDNRFALIQISKEAYTRMQEIAAGIIKLNGASGINIVETTSKSMHIGGDPFNGFIVVSFVLLANASSYASKIRNQYGGSIDVGYKNNAGAGAGVIATVDLPEKLQYTPCRDGIAVYAGPAPSSLTYRESIIGGVSGGVEIALLGTLYVDDQLIPIPADSLLSERSAQLIKTTAIREPDYDGYQLANEVQGMYDSFVLFSQLYFVDSDWIKAIALTAGNIVTSANKVAPVRGLQFITASPTEAFFLSAFDNSLYSFGGGQSVTKGAIFNRHKTIRAGIYSVVENTLALLTDDTVIFIRDAIITETITPFLTAPDAFATVDGIWLSQSGYAIHYVFNLAGLSGVTPITDTIDGGVWGTSYPDSIDGGAWGTAYDTLDGGAWGAGYALAVPLLWQSKFLGFSDRHVQMIDRFLIRLYKEDLEQTTISITFEYFAETTVYSESRDIIVGDINYPWDSDGYGYIEFVPTEKRSIAASLKIECQDKIAIIAVISKLSNEGESLVLNR